MNTKIKTMKYNFENRKTILGFDPSFINFGVAIYNPKTKEMILKSGEMMSVINWMKYNVRLSECVAIVENPALDSPVFGEWQKIMRLILTSNKSDLSKVNSQFSQSMKKAQHIGENKASAKLLLRMLAERNVPVLEIAPSKRQKAYKKDAHGNKIYQKVWALRMPTKTTSNQFSELTGFSGKSTEHSRDAGTLIHGQTITGIKNKILIQKAKNAPKSNPGSHNDNFFLVKRSKS